MKYDDGDLEASVPAARIRTLTGPHYKPFKTGDRVMGNYLARNRWYAGTVGRVYTACCYEVKYDDGDRENCADPTNMKKIAQGKCEDSQKNKCEAHYRVQANWKGYGRYYSAVVNSCKFGTFSVHYDDGDTEDMVTSDNLLNCEKCDSKRQSTLARVGSKVYANWMGRGNWLEATVSGLNLSHCKYSVKYLGGQAESNVMDTRVCPVAAQYYNGQKIEARWQGDAKYFKGTIVGRNAFGSAIGTYKINYDDGDKEDSVPCYLIRKP